MNSIWEGSGNVQCLDVLRTLSRTPEAIDVLLAELTAVQGCHTLYDRALEELTRWLRENTADAFKARIVTERMALLLQASLLELYSVPEVATSFIESRLQPETLAYGGLKRTDAVDALLNVIALE